MEVRRPPLVPAGFVVAVAGRREVVDERVEPHIDDALLVEGDGYAPVEPRPADREVRQPRFEDSGQFVAPRFRFDETGVVPVEREQAVAVTRQPEEVVPLADPVRLAAVDRADSVVEVLLLLERFAGNAVPTLVGALVEVAGAADRAEQFLHGRPVPPLGRAHELVERDVQLRPDAAKHFLHPFAVGERFEPLLGGLPADIQGVFVRPHQEVRVVPGAPPEPGDHIRGDLLVGGAEVRGRVDIVDRRGEVVAGHAAGILRSAARVGAFRGPGGRGRRRGASPG